MYRKHFSAMFLPCLYREFVDRGIEQFDAAVTGRGEDLVFVDLGPCEIIKRILRSVSINTITVSKQDPVDTKKKQLRGSGAY